MEAKHLMNKEEKKQWVGTWAASPYFITPDNMPPSPGLAHNTLRQIIKVSIGGDQFRFKFSNEYGDSSMELNSVHIAVSKGKDHIQAETDCVITFDGKEAVTIPAGATVVSDTIPYTINPLELLAITIHFGIVPSKLTGHPGSRTNSYIDIGNTVAASSIMDRAVATERWYVITGMDVLVDSSYRSIVALGDSITDGRGTTTDLNNRWTDILANRLQEEPSTAKVGVLNQGIGGNAVVSGGLGPNATSRFDRDVLGQEGVRYLILLEGVNDIGSDSSDLNTADNLINAYREFIKKAHEHNILVYGATILPFGESFYYTQLHEEIRQKINQWIRTSDEFDAVIDFDAAVRREDKPDTLVLDYDSGDHLHLSPAGYKRMGDIIDLKLFTR